ncbi:MAG: hypothetical protein HXO18_03625 [Prevotella shahii]|uniref:hypothetical protein n=1 Tax=Hoylesella shahii TaxID=228603 RepID=UPI001CB44975|nr:hypothetical protein [Hoylesella shahii]MBF1568157.1 hypothetical protein [Hoylesella shahii]
MRRTSNLVAPQNGFVADKLLGKTGNEYLKSLPFLAISAPNTPLANAKNHQLGKQATRKLKNYQRIDLPTRKLKNLPTHKLTNL